MRRHFFFFFGRGVLVLLCDKGANANAADDERDTPSYVANRQARQHKHGSSDSHNRINFNGTETIKPAPTTTYFQVHIKYFVQDAR
jgi:hypothetical protein